MTRRIFCKVLLVVVAIFGLLVLSSILSAQGNRDWALEHVKDVQERNTDRLLAMDGVEGTAIGYNQNEQLAVKIFTAGPGVRGIPRTLEGVPVQVVVTGKFYALVKPPSPPGQDKKDRPPAAPTGLTAAAVSDTDIYLDWNDNGETDLAYYNVYRSTTTGSYGDPIASNVTTSSYSDTVEAISPIYYYVVTAVDLAGNESDYSNEAWATTDPGSEPPEDKPPLWCERPVPIGVSTGHPDITAGTIGCRVTDGTNVYALSNNHVYADENNALIGDNVLQPGTYDGGVDPDDAIGTLADFVTIYFDESANTVDAAIALSGTNLLGNATPADDPDGYGTPSSTTVSIDDVDVGLAVQKYGRTTGLTKGKVSEVNATVNVIYGSGTALFVNQIVIMPDRGWFSKGGDSGSLIVTDDDGKNPVGLLFAGGGRRTIANPIDLVLDVFSVDIDGTP